MTDDKFKLLFEHSSDAHLIITGDRITDCNAAAVELLNAGSKEDILCRHPAEFSPQLQPDGSSSLEKSAQMDALARQRGYHRFEWFHKKITGEVFPVQVTLNSLDIDGKPSLIAVWHDLTNLKKAEQKLKIANKKMRKELEAASEIQRGLLPTSSPLLKGLRASWIFKPCSELGGDMLNIFHLDEKNLGLYILDVTGHGVAASLLSVSISQFLSPFSETSFVRSAHEQNRLALAPPSEVVHKLNRHFSSNPERIQMFTLFYAVLNVESRELCYVSAGHPDPIIITQEGQSTPVIGSGIPIGVLDGFEYSEVCLKLNPGDRLYLYSDGIPEAKSPSRGRYHQDRLIKKLSSTRPLNLAESLEQIVLEVDAWCRPARPNDDITLLACELCPTCETETPA